MFPFLRVGHIITSFEKRDHDNIYIACMLSTNIIVACSKCSHVIVIIKSAYVTIATAIIIILCIHVSVVADALAVL